FINSFFFFFFQAEDGIRDGHVTGVQTCALPICFLETRTRTGPCPGLPPGPPAAGSAGAPGSKRLASRRQGVTLPGRQETAPQNRSEERRVGKEGRLRWSAEHVKKKKRTAKRERI